MEVGGARGVSRWFLDIDGDPSSPWASRIQIDRLGLHTLALMLVLAQLALRTWMLRGSWFYTDDYRLLAQARGTPLDADYLASPFDSQFMPLGRLIAWLVANTGEVATNWTLAVTITLTLSTLAAAACWWMLTTIFGPRPATLVLLSVYLFSALTVPALMWWAAGLNQLPLQAIWFASVAAWVRYLRTQRWVWLTLTIFVVAFGMLAYVKTLIVLPVLVVIMLAYFAAGSWWTRISTGLTTYRVGVVSGAALAGTYGLYYLLAVPQAFVEQKPTLHLAVSLLDTMIATAFGSSAIGGPWRWDSSNPPTGYADPPALASLLAWIALIGMVALTALRRQRSGRAWLVLVITLAGAYGLLLTTRAPLVGAGIGLEMRYLTETSCALVLALGLAWLPVLGATESSERRTSPLLTAAPSRPLLLGVWGAYLIGAVVSTLTYAHIWHTDNPGEAYLRRVSDAVGQAGRVSLANTTVPANVVPGYSYPYNTLGELVPLFTDGSDFPLISTALHTVAPDGSVVPAVLDAKVGSPPGPITGCGWEVDATGRTIPLRARTIDLDWWVRVGYLASERTQVTVTAGDVSRSTTLNPGLGSLFVQVAGSFDEVAISGLEPGARLCVDGVEVGGLGSGAS